MRIADLLRDLDLQSMTLPNVYTGDTPLVWPGASYTLRYDWRALGALQTAFDGRLEERIGEILARPLAAGRDFATLVAAGLAKHHPEMTPEAIEDLSPPLSPVLLAVSQALSRAFNGTDAPPVGEAPADPPKAVASTR